MIRAGEAPDHGVVSEERFFQPDAWAVPAQDEAAMPETRLIRCPSCGVTNRVPLDKVEIGLKPVCGRCKTPIPVDDKPLTVTDATFAAEVERSPLPVVLDMWAAWCGPCQMIAPVLDELASEMAGRKSVV